MESIPRPFTIRYNPYTQSVQVVNSKKGIQILASDIKYDVRILEEAIKNNMLENNAEVCLLNFDWLKGAFIACNCLTIHFCVMFTFSGFS